MWTWCAYEIITQSFAAHLLASNLMTAQCTLDQQQSLQRQQNTHEKTSIFCVWDSESFGEHYSAWIHSNCWILQNGNRFAATSRREKTDHRPNHRTNHFADMLHFIRMQFRNTLTKRNGKKIYVEPTWMKHVIPKLYGTCSAAQWKNEKKNITKSYTRRQGECENRETNVNSWKTRQVHRFGCLFGIRFVNEIWIWPVIRLALRHCNQGVSAISYLLSFAVFDLIILLFGVAKDGQKLVGSVISMFSSLLKSNQVIPNGWMHFYVIEFFDLFPQCSVMTRATKEWFIKSKNEQRKIA